ncbi:MAG: maleylpyruvate isomerase family mycothiol-dependent enzyme [Actinobacteria bacterium]|nr:maleylpyruvate isomerase family mycothiol-dependent enzyme [Actinomycetota bacterium]
MSLGDASHPRDEVAVQRLGMMSGACEVECSGIPQFRKDNEVRFTDHTVRFAENSVDPVVDAFGVVALHLDQRNPHPSVTHTSTLLADGQLVNHDRAGFPPGSGKRDLCHSTSPYAGAMSDALLDNWDQAIENFAAFVSTVDDWEIASPCPGWSVSDLVAHIIDLESQLAGDPQPEHTPDWSSLSHVSSDFGRFTEIGVDYRRGRSHESLLAELTDCHTRARERLSSLPSDASLPWLRGDTPLPRLLGMRTFDVWVHEQDIRMAVGQPGNTTGPGAREALKTLTSALPKIWAKNAGAPAGAVLEVAITEPGLSADLFVAVGDDGKAAFTDGGEPVASLSMPWMTFVALACGRSPDVDLSSSVHLSGDHELASTVLGSLAVTP